MLGRLLAAPISPAASRRWRRPPGRTSAAGLASVSRRHVPVSVNDRVLDAVRGRGDLSVDVPSGCAGNNHPERRRNVILDALLGNASTASALRPAPAAGSLKAGELVHTEGFVHFLGSAFRRWETELLGDASYRLPQQEEVALVPFHCVKSERPRAPGLAAEFACYASDFETPILESTASALRDDLGVVLAATDLVLSGAAGAAYALTTHPGHHSGPGYFGGFCYINGASVACALLARSGLRPALLDLDFHGGNGSFDIADRTGTWFRSINCAGAYPWVDMGGQGVELPPGTGWEGGYAAALRGALEAVPAQAGALVVSLGYDTLASDPEAGKRAGSGLALAASDFFAMGEMLLLQAKVPVLVVQEGGYDLDQIPFAALEFLRGLSGSSR